MSGFSGGGGGVTDHTLLTNIGTNTHAQLDTHLAASAAVHGLPASVNVLGNRNAAGEFVQRGSVTSTGTSGADSTLGLKGLGSVTFPVAFSATPKVLCSIMAALESYGAYLTGESSTGFSATVYGTASSSMGGTFVWLALGT